MTPSVDIRLRALEPEDLGLLYDIENDPQFWQYGSTTVPYSRYALRRYLEETQNDLFADGQVRLVIETRSHLSSDSCKDAEGRVKKAETKVWTAVGLADLFNLDALHLRAEIGLVILPEYQGKHYAEEAVKQLCNYARGLMLHQLTATIAVTNEKASRLFERLGFIPSARLSDWLRTMDDYVDAVVWQKIICPDRCRESHLRESLH